jgi:hypothetical protein
LNLVTTKGWHIGDNETKLNKLTYHAICVCQGHIAPASILLWELGQKNAMTKVVSMSVKAEQKNLMMRRDKTGRRGGGTTRHNDQPGGLY